MVFKLFGEITTSSKTTSYSMPYLQGSRLADLHLVLPNEVPQLCC